MTNLEIVLIFLLAIYVFTTFVSVLAYMRDVAKHPYRYTFLFTFFAPILIWYVLFVILKEGIKRAKNN